MRSGAMNAVNCALVPEPSERITGTILMGGSTRPPLSAVIAGSFHNVMTPVKIFANVGGDSRRFVTRLPFTSRWYMNDVPPATIGRYA
jgi:hypothetical protein